MKVIPVSRRITRSPPKKQDLQNKEIKQINPQKFGIGEKKKCASKNPPLLTQCNLHCRKEQSFSFRFLQEVWLSSTWARHSTNFAKTVSDFLHCWHRTSCAENGVQTTLLTVWTKNPLYTVLFHSQSSVSPSDLDSCPFLPL